MPSRPLVAAIPLHRNWFHGAHDFTFGRVVCQFKSLSNGYVGFELTLSSARVLTIISIASESICKHVCSVSHLEKDYG